MTTVRQNFRKIERNGKKSASCVCPPLLYDHDDS